MARYLLDENLPVRLKQHFPPDIEVLTVYDMRWSSLKNGELLKRLAAEGFSGLITSDQHIIHQQNIAQYSLKIFVIKVKNNRYGSIVPMVHKIIDSIRSEATQQVFIIN
jgi:hypothetical protein